MKTKKSDVVLDELKHHMPFTLAASFSAGILVAIFYLVGRIPSEELFEVIHPAHILVSAIATSAIYWKNKKSIWRAILIGMSGAIIVGTLSDALFPFLAGNLFSLHTHLHLPILEEPVLILGIAFLGSVLGMYSYLFRVSHLLHVFLSIFASLFYLLAFSIKLDAVGILLISGLVFLVVYIPCCISDIVFPLLFLNKPCLDCGHWH